MDKYEHLTLIMNKYRMMLAVELYEATKGTDLEQDMLTAISCNKLIPHNKIVECPLEIDKHPIEYMLDGYTEPIKISTYCITRPIGLEE